MSAKLALAALLGLLAIACTSSNEVAPAPESVTPTATRLLTPTHSVTPHLTPASTSTGTSTPGAEPGAEDATTSTGATSTYTEPEGDAERATITAGSVPVRIGPNEQYPIVGYLTRGDAVTVVGSDREDRSPPEWLAIKEAGWIRYADDIVDVDTSVLSFPTNYPLGPLYDGDPATQISMVDLVIASTLRMDSQSLASLLRFQTLDCTNVPAFYESQPSCPDGVAEGTEVQAFPVIAQHFGWAHSPPEEILAQFLFLPDGTQGGQLRLYAVAQVQDELRIERDFWIVFGNDAGIGRAITVDEEGITSLIRLEPVSKVPDFLMGFDAASLVVPPLTPAGLSSEPAR